ncbi:hypothetical protein [Frankia nepalensis]|uniref:hypothetical protein n=1 Tax=Frankia nepalensis TaxID=1836974 RepID=UPI0027DCCEE0|nr:hypothetical protein [Frankia nepalensis]
MDTGPAASNEPLRAVTAVDTPDDEPSGVEVTDRDTAGPLAGQARHRPRPRKVVDLAVPAALAATVVAALVALRAVLDRPLWYDEIWRPHFLAEPAATFWSELAHANTPSALGWAALTRLVGEVAGWHAWALRLPELVALVALPAVAYAFVRRFTGPAAAGLAAASLGLSGVVVDLGTQLKPYAVEALAALAVVWLWGAARRPTVARTTAGAVSLFAVPAAFLIIPLAAGDVVAAGRGWRPRARAALTAAPALAICGLHTALFIGHQSSQRASRFWDTQFLAGRGPLDAVGFVAGELVRILGGAPTGVDRYDPNLVHPATDATFAAAWLLAPAAALAFAFGVVALHRFDKIGQPMRDPGDARRLTHPDGGRAGSPASQAMAPAHAWGAGRQLLVAVLGALLIALAASVGRYWPFGANRTNTFLVPLLVAVVAVGADRVGPRRGAPPAAGRGGAGPGAPPGGRWRATALAWRAVPAGRVVLAGALVVLAAAPVASASALWPLWRERHEIRPVALMVDATTLARGLYQPGDVVVVGGRLARSGWLYATGVSDDGPYLPPPAAAAPPAGPRLPEDSTLFLTAVGEGEARAALAARTGPAPERLLLFVLVYDRGGADAELADLRAAGWCPTETFEFPGTGTLRVLGGCAGGPSAAPSAGG